MQSTIRPASDESLLAGLVCGDAEMEIAFVRHFQDRVYGLARRLVGDAGLAEDVAQEAFLRAWRHAPAFDPCRGSVATWLLAITRNLAIDALRRRRAVPVDPDLLIFMGTEAHGHSPDELVVQADAATRLREAVKRLPAEQRRAVVKAYFYGQTAQDISTSEGIPLGTAKTRIRAGMTKLRAATLEEAEAAKRGANG
jgi:RNA polymerase sigma factor (sigma-70 family)